VRDGRLRDVEGNHAGPDRLGGTMSTPSPSPSSTIDNALTAAGFDLLVVGVIVSVLVALGALLIMAVLLFKSSKLANPAPIVASVSMPSAVSLVVYAVTQAAEAATLAATGLGALAGTLSSIYGRVGKTDKQDVNEEKANE